MNLTLRDRITGMFLGVAIGDALYMPTEIFGPKKIREVFGGRVTTYFDAPPHHPFQKDLKAGMWTDDTQLTLVMAEAIIAKGRIDFLEIARQHVIALQESVNGWGGTTRQAVENLRGGAHFMTSGIEGGSGNGVSMKIAPMGAYYAARNLDIRSDDAVQSIADVACMTHLSRLGVESGLAHCGAIHYCLTTTPSSFSLEKFIESTQIYFDHDLRSDVDMNHPSVQERILTLRNISLADLDTEMIRTLFGNGRGYVYDSLPFSYAFFLKNPFHIDALYDVGNAGGDTDTNASMVGGLLGALNGPGIFPNHLVRGLYRKEHILDVARRFCDTLAVSRALS